MKNRFLMVQSPWSIYQSLKTRGATVRPQAPQLICKPTGQQATTSSTKKRKGFKKELIIFEGFRPNGLQKRNQRILLQRVAPVNIYFTFLLFLKLFHTHVTNVAINPISARAKYGTCRADMCGY